MGANTQSSPGLLRDVGLPARYPIVRRIARGGMASVWCAQDVVLGRRVAIKLLAEQYAADHGAVMRFQREARAAARLSGHTNVVTIYDVGRTRPVDEPAHGRPFIVMECLAGGTVGDAIRVGEVSRADAVRWIEEAAAALDYGHGRGIIHRDIKPANLLLDNQRVLHVADFGIARVATEDTITSAGELFGTAAYISPEQALGRPATEASDRYALAVVAYELLVGERPFSGQSFAVQARQHVDDDPPRASARNPELPPAVDAVLARGMAKAPQERWPSAKAFAQALELALDPDRRTAGLASSADRPAPLLPAAAALPPLFTRTGARSRHRPRAFAAAALAAAALALAAAALALAAAVVAGQGGGGPRTASVAQAAGARRPATASATRHGGVRHRHAPAARKPAPAPPPTTTGTPAAATTAAPTADTLEARGHELLASGQAGTAVGVLRQAVAAASPSSLTYAYALYDLGKALLLSGDPRDAAVILQKRLQIPNQTEVVRQTLQQALRQLGAQVSSSGGASANPAPAPAPSKHDGHPGHGSGGGGGGGGD